jgi:hypothetical protein
MKTMTMMTMSFEQFAAIAFNVIHPAGLGRAATVTNRHPPPP